MNCRNSRVTGMVVCLAILSASPLASAGRYKPEAEWLQMVQVAEPILPYRLGVVEFKEGNSDEWLEYMGDLRATLRGSNYFRSASAPRLKLQIERGIQGGSFDEDGCTTSAGALSLTYRFFDGQQEVSRFAITTKAPMNGDSNDFTAAMSGNLKYLLLELRKAQGDTAFAATAETLATEIQRDLASGSSLGCNVGMALANGFVATVEGTIAVFEGVGEVAGAALEVAASPEFQNTLNAEMANYQAQQAQQDAYYRNLQAQANTQAEAERQRQVAEQQAKAEQQRAGHEALAKQLADGIAYRNQQMAKTTDAATLAKLRRDNEAAMQAAQQIGMYSKVDSMATQATQAGFDQARTQRVADEQAEKQRLAAARAEQERQQREQEARQRAEQQRLAAEQARVQRELEAKQRAEQQRLAAERIEQQKKQAWSEYLATYQRTIRLGARQCDGKDKPYRLIGDRPANPLPKVISHYSSCISVHYEARCPGTPRGAGIKATQYNFTGMGLGCLSAESLMPQRLACKDDDVIVDTRDVTGCGG